MSSKREQTQKDRRTSNLTNTNRIYVSKASDDLIAEVRVLWYTKASDKPPPRQQDSSENGLLGFTFMEMAPSKLRTIAFLSQLNVSRNRYVFENTTYHNL